uniref:Uncharacterized protein n=1 Tax=Naja naja TaxID=35670 RepID=A0A8C7E5C3_NAJNA
MLLAYQEDMFTIHTVEEILWGYTDKFLKTLHKFFPNVDPVFGYFKEMNATDDGEYVMLSGEKNYLDFTRVIEWNGKDKLDWWTTPSCNMINGTDGETFHSLISKDERIYIFSTDFCRSPFRLGIPTHRFAPPLEIFANISVNPDNAGFCVPAGHCEGSGILNVTGCKKGEAPILLSPPHFLHSEDTYAKMVDGMHPNKQDHDTFLDINPVSLLFLWTSKSSTGSPLPTAAVEPNISVWWDSTFFTTVSVGMAWWVWCGLVGMVWLGGHGRGRIL